MSDRSQKRVRFADDNFFAFGINPNIRENDSINNNQKSAIIENSHQSNLPSIQHSSLPLIIDDDNNNNTKQNDNNANFNEKSFAQFFTQPDFSFSEVQSLPTIPTNDENTSISPMKLLTSTLTSSGPINCLNSEPFIPQMLSPVTPTPPTQPTPELAAAAPAVEAPAHPLPSTTTAEPQVSTSVNTAATSNVEQIPSPSVTVVDVNNDDNSDDGDRMDVDETINNRKNNNNNNNSNDNNHINNNINENIGDVSDDINVPIFPPINNSPSPAVSPPPPSLPSLQPIVQETQSSQPSPSIQSSTLPPELQRIRHELPPTFPPISSSPVKSSTNNNQSPPVLPAKSTPSMLSPVPELFPIVQSSSDSNRLSFDPSLLDPHMLGGTRQLVRDPCVYIRQPLLSDVESSVCRAVCSCYGFNIGSLVASGKSVKESIELMTAWYTVENIQKQYPYEKQVEPQQPLIKKAIKSKRIIVKRKIDNEAENNNDNDNNDNMVDDGYNDKNDSDEEEEELVILKTEGIYDNKNPSSRTSREKSGPNISRESIKNSVNNMKKKLSKSSANNNHNNNLDIAIERVDSASLSYKSGIAPPWTPSITKGGKLSKALKYSSHSGLYQCEKRWVDDFGFTQRCEFECSGDELEMKLHQREVHEQKNFSYNFSCSHCKSQIKSAKHFQQHLKDCHQELENSLARRSEKGGFMIEIKNSKNHFIRDRPKRKAATEKTKSTALSAAQQQQQSSQQQILTRKRKRILVDEEEEENNSNNDSDDADDGSGNDSKFITKLSVKENNGYSYYDDRKCNYEFIYEPNGSKHYCEFGGTASELKFHREGHNEKIRRKYICSHCKFGHSNKSVVEYHVDSCHKRLDKELKQQGKPVGKVIEQKVSSSSANNSKNYQNKSNSKYEEENDSESEEENNNSNKKEKVNNNNKSRTTRDRSSTSSSSLFHSPSSSPSPAAQRSSPSASKSDMNSFPSLLRCPIKFFINHKEYQCEFVASSHNNESKWIKHRELHDQTKSSSYECSHCQAQSSDMKLIRLHLQFHHHKLDTELTARGEPIGRVIFLKSHNNNNDDEEEESKDNQNDDNNSDDNNSNSSNNEKLTQQYQSEIDNIKNKSSSSPSPPLYNCFVTFLCSDQPTKEYQCEYSNNSKELYHEHFEQHYTSNNLDNCYQCSLCQLKSNTVNSIIQHILIDHKKLNMERERLGLTIGKCVKKQSEQKDEAKKLSNQNNTNYNNNNSSSNNSNTNSNYNTTTANNNNNYNNSISSVNKVQVKREPERQGEEDHEPLDLSFTQMTQ